MQSRRVLLWTSILTFLLCLTQETLAQGTRSVLFGAGNANVWIQEGARVDNAITLEAWIYPMAMPEADAIIFRRYTGSDPYFIYSLHLHRDNPSTDPVAVFALSDGTPGSVVSVSSGTLPLFQWTHVSATYDGSTLRIYLNGGTPNTAGASLTIPSDPSQIRMGIEVAPTIQSHFFGFVDEMRQWNVARSAAQISSSMGGLTPGDDTGLIGYWQFEHAAGGLPATGTPAIDSSSSHNDGEYRVGAHTESFSPFDPAGTPSLSVSPPSINLGTVVEGTSVSSSVTIDNTAGSQTLVGFYNVQANFLTSVRTVFVVPATSSLSPAISVLPTGPGAISGTVDLGSHAGSTSIPISGTAVESKEKFTGNNISAFVTRNGEIGHSPSGVSAVEWPGGSGKTLMYQTGLWLAAKVGGDLRTAAADYNPEFQAGPAPGGVPATPTDPTYRVYRISAGDNAGTNPDYAAWPAGLGAPVDGLGNPLILGSQTLFAVYNDLNPSLHHFGSLPLGAEVQETIYGFGGNGSLSNTMFVKLKIVNRSASTWDNAYAAIWADPDVGNYLDDFVGSDVSRDLGFAYNAEPVDDIYGATPPAVGEVFLKGTGPGQALNAFSYYLTGGPPVR